MVFVAKKVELPHFGEKIKKLRQEAGLTQAKVAQLLNIQEKYLDCLEKGEIEKMPAGVYVKGFLRKYAALLRADADELVEEYASEEKISWHWSREKTAPKKLPSLRFGSFTVTPQLVSWAAILVFVGLVAGYFFWQLNFLLGSPSLELFAPREDLTVNNNEFVIKGKTEPGVKLTLNSQEVNLDREGSFEQKINLAKGINVVEVTAINRFGKSVSVKRQIMLE